MHRFSATISWLFSFLLGHAAALLQMILKAPWTGLEATLELQCIVRAFGNRDEEVARLALVKRRKRHRQIMLAASRSGKKRPSVVDGALNQLPGRRKIAAGIDLESDLV
jgi:hypothetical protein